MAGAMEDWGLVSFRSAYLIFDPTIMTVETMRQITLVIAHELAHQVKKKLWKKIINSDSLTEDFILRRSLS